MALQMHANHTDLLDKRKGAIDIMRGNRMYRFIQNYVIYLQVKITFEPGVVAHVCNPYIWKAETGRSGSVVSLSYLERPRQLSETLFQNKD